MPAKAEPEKKAEDQKTEEEQPTPEQLQEQAKTMMEGLGYQPKELPKGESKGAEKEKEKAAESATPNEKKKEEPKKEVKPSPKKEPSVAPTAPAPAPFNEDSIAEKVAAKLAPKAAEKKDELNAEDMRTREVLAVLAERDEYKTIVGEFDRFLTAEKKYQAEWERSNHGKVFNPDDEIHNEFYDANEPEYKENDFVRAEAKLEARGETKSFFEKREKERERQELVTATNGRVRQNRDELETSFIEMADDGFKGVKTIEELKKKDAVAAYVLKDTLREVQAITTELDLIYTSGLEYKVDQEKPAHVALMARIGEYERQLSQLAPERTEADGRPFVTWAQYERLSPDDQKRCWTIWLDPARVKRGLVADALAVAKQELATVRPEKQGGERKDSAKETKAPETATQQIKEEERFPNTSGGGDQVLTPGTSKGAPKNDAEIIMGGLFS